ncbi:DUF2690 domain-containing protein [Micromonospora soli]|uniref:DUF2690 domain-containing protein n=1 Tax=Micromonospora sp. NBRC 110009 TaxID=3061627 RepID=UPI0026740A9A|nr:DUF2690 domain-containing protein [Micromonospora sp. NBRC 110009]WKU01029.1 DUF2690 domain-containing protein [Micromonospora sp. NBRC 110009]
MLKKRLVELGAALALCLSAAVAAPQAASAAPAPTATGSATTIRAADLDPAKATMIAASTLATSGCGSSCDGRNPATYKIYYNGSDYYTCAEDAITAAQNTSGINLELRYSPRCRTAWARVSSDFYYPTVRSYYSDGRVRTSYSGFAGSYYTMMVNDAGLLARAEATAGSGTWYTSKY